MKNMLFLTFLVFAANAATTDDDAVDCAKHIVEDYDHGMDYNACNGDKACVWAEKGDSDAMQMTCDATIAGMTINSFRSQYLMFTRGYYTNSMGVMGKVGAAAVETKEALNVAGNTILLGADTAPIKAIGDCDGETTVTTTCLFPDATIIAVEPKCSDDTSAEKDCTGALTWMRSREVAAELVEESTDGKTYFVHDGANIAATSAANAQLITMGASFPASATENEMFGMSTRNSSKDLRGALEMGLSEIIADGKYGTYYKAAFGNDCDGTEPCLHNDSTAKTATKWPELTADSRLKAIVDAGTMTWCMNTFEPFHDGSGAGFDADVAKAIVEKMATKYDATIKFEYDSEEWSTLIGGFGECVAAEADEPEDAEKAPAASLALGLALLAPIIAML